MKTIQWQLPFKEVSYLNSMTAEIANNPSVILITAVQDATGFVDSCNIMLRDSENTDEVIFMLGATLGAHSVAYALETMYQLEEEQETEEIEEQEEEQEQIEEEVTTEEIEEVIKKTPDSPAKALLRKILSNFKKGAAAIIAAIFLS